MYIGTLGPWDPDTVRGMGVQHIVGLLLGGCLPTGALLSRPDSRVVDSLLPLLLLLLLDTVRV